MSVRLPDELAGARSRLFVLLAERAPVAVIVRRGPSAWTQLVLWNTQTDAFTPGAWFRGRIYAEKCDVSPDGQLFVYAAHQGHRLGSTYTDSWTAVSRPPWLHALVLWPMGTTYGGGGKFVSDRRLIVRGARNAHEKHPLRGLELVPGAADIHRSSGEVDGAEWSGRDQRGRLVFTARGRVFARNGSEDTALTELNQACPDPQPAPEWATRPIS